MTEEKIRTATRIQPVTEGITYLCYWCRKPIGTLAEVKLCDKFDRVYCSSGCSMAAYNHPSREYEKRGGDY